MSRTFFAAPFAALVIAIHLAGKANAITAFWTMSYFWLRLAHAVVFRLSVKGHPIEGVDYLRLDEDGRVQKITVSMRPLASLQVLADQMRETVARLTGTMAP